MSTADKIAEFRAAHTRNAGAAFDHWLDRACESPIEQLLLATMFARGWGPNEHTVCNWYSLHEQCTSLGFAATPWLLGTEQVSCFCVLQLPVSFGPTRYRIDFAFIECFPQGKPRMFAVELDGHDFHERTKDQASRDKRRDRAFAAHGWTVLRYTGADVYRDPGAVLDEIVGLANRQCWPWLEEP